MEKDTIITLEDGEMYALLDESEIEGSKYFFAVKLDKNENPTTEYEVFEEEVDDGEVYMGVLEEGDFKQVLLVDFTNNYMHMVGDLMDSVAEIKVDE